jgi:hypothetical protein
VCVCVCVYVCVCVRACVRVRVSVWCVAGGSNSSRNTQHKRRTEHPELAAATEHEPPVEEEDIACS